MWNMRKIHFSHNWKTAAARTAVKGGRSPARREAGLPLDGHRSGGYAARAAPGCPFPPRRFLFNTFTPQQPPRLHRTTIAGPPFPLVADFTQVYPEKPVNASVYAAPGCMALIAFTFPQSNFRLLRSFPPGVTCHPTADAVGGVVLPTATLDRTASTEARG